MCTTIRFRRSAGASSTKPTVSFTPSALCQYLVVNAAIASRFDNAGARASARSTAGRFTGFTPMAVRAASSHSARGRARGVHTSVRSTDLALIGGCGVADAPARSWFVTVRREREARRDRLLLEGASRIWEDGAERAGSTDETRTTTGPHEADLRRVAAGRPRNRAAARIRHDHVSVCRRARAADDDHQRRTSLDRPGATAH